jgi:hypothetical protein
MSALAPVELTNEVMTWAERAKSIIVNSPETYTAAGQMLVAVKGIIKQVDETFDLPIKRAHESHKEVIAARDKHRVPLLEFEKAAKQKMASYHEEQERIRRAEQLRIEAELRKQEEEARLAEAIVLEDMGEPDEAEAVLAAPSTQAVVQVASAAPKVAGISYTDHWSAEVDSLYKFVMWAVREQNAVGLINAYLLPNMPAFNKSAGALKSLMSMPGVRAVNKPTPNVRS